MFLHGVVQRTDAEIPLNSLVAEARQCQEDTQLQGLILSLVVEPQVLGKDRINLFGFLVILHREKRDNKILLQSQLCRTNSKTSVHIS